MTIDHPSRSAARAVALQREYFLSGATRSVSARKAALTRLRRAIAAREAAIIAAVEQDLGRVGAETYLSEIGPTLGEIDFAIKHVDRWARPRRVPTPLVLFKAASAIHPEPYGVSVIVSPWNFPFFLLFMPLIGAIAAGNTAILRLSPDSPASAALISQIVGEIFDPRHVLALPGPHEVTNELLRAGIDKVFFTGSPGVGSHVLAMAAANLVPATLELGGKSPAIVDEDADIPLSARRIMWGKLLNAGQSCMAPDHVYVHEHVKDRFVEGCVRSIRQFYGPAPLDSPEYPHIVNARHYARLEAYLKDGRILAGGGTDPATRRIEPTLMDRISGSSRLLQDEIFGPILPVFEFDSLAMPLAELRGRDRPLALYYFSASAKKQEQMIRASSSGGVTINDTVVHCGSPFLPFGGIGRSGMGAYHGQYSFDAFTHYKAVMYRSTRIDPSMRYPPLAGKLRKLRFLRKLL